MAQNVVYGGFPTPFVAVEHAPYNLNAAELGGRTIRIREMRDGEGKICWVSAIGYITGRNSTGGGSGVVETTEEFSPSEAKDAISLLMDMYKIPRERAIAITKFEPEKDSHIDDLF